MNFLDEQPISCPYCGETITVLIDCSVAEQSYTEDCQVCCQPIVLDIAVEDDALVSLVARREDE